MNTDDDDDDGFQFTPENLLDNIDRLGPWSLYALAETALEYYHPSLKRYAHDPLKLLERQMHFMEKDGMKYWSDVIIKFQKEVGYYAPDGFNRSAVNEY